MFKLNKIFIIKIIIFMLLFVLTFIISRLFLNNYEEVEGIKVIGKSMHPTIMEGDIIQVDKFDGSVSDLRGKIIMFEYKGTNMVKRVIAVQGDTVEIDWVSLKVNGEYYYRANVHDAYIFANQTIKLRPGEVYVIGDNLSESIDSRMYGCVNSNFTDIYILNTDLNYLAYLASVELNKVSKVISNYYIK